MKSRRADLRNGSRRGVVLFEVVLALFIFTTVAFSLVLALNGTMEAAKARNEVDNVVMGFKNQLSLIKAARVVPIDKDLPDDGSGVTYHLTIEPEQLRDQKQQPVAGMFRATITAKWKSGRQDEGRSISELIYQP